MFPFFSTSTEWEAFAFMAPSWDSGFLLEPTLLAASLLLLITIFCDKSNTIFRLVVVAILIFLGLRYLGWRMGDTLNWQSGAGIASLSVALLALELFLFFVNTISTWFLYAFMTNRSSEADAYQINVANQSFLPGVDVFIPTYNEPLTVLRRTIAGCLAMTYPNKKIFLLDDGQRQEVKLLAHTMGVHYIDRADNEHYKAGNINNALKQTNNPFICVFDADFIPVPHFLNRVIGFFQNPTIALVQTPQAYYTPDLIQLNLGINKFSSEQDLFFRTIQPGRDAFNAVICCGTSFVIRRAPLEALGGIPTETITEDLMTSVYLQASGFEVVYLNETLSFGEASNRSVDHLKQRTRWARGILQTLYTPVKPFTCRGLNFWQRFYHLIALLYWVTPLPRLILLLLPLSFFFFGTMPIVASLEGILSYFVPLYACSLVAMSWFNQGKRSPFWSDVYELIPAFVLIPNLAHTLLDPFGLGFKVTPKGSTSTRLAINWQVGLPCLVLMTLFLLGIGHAVINWIWFENKESLALNLVWSLYALGILWLCFMACIDVPQKRQNLRFQLPMRYSLKVGNKRFQGESLDISEQGCRLPLTGDTSALANGATEKGLLTLSELALYDMPVTLNKISSKSPKEISENTFFCRFPNLGNKAYSQLIGGVLKKASASWDEQPLSEWHYFWHFVKSPFRMYPLTNQSGDQ